MATLNLKADMLRKMFLSGAKNLEIRKNYINELNVFPVPDGDTGTNMTLTILSAAQEVNRLENVGWATLKRSFDIIASVLGLLVLSPLLIAISIGVKLSSPGPIFFRQIRVGYRRREFQMLKFRSMRENTESDTAWSTAYDGRRTRFGALLRKTSLDELPQLINVLKGDMSLVGPRPELPHFVERFREEIPFYMVKHQVKPGITGWAQVNGYRGDTSIQKRIEMDLWYIDHWSIWLDLKILCKTFPKAMINSEQIGKECKRA